VPPLNDKVVERAGLCPESIGAGATEITGAVSAASTVTETALERTGTGVSELSTTCNLKLHVPVAVRVPVGTVGLLPEVQSNGVPRPL
jgi:hypothetical protein